MQSLVRFDQEGVRVKLTTSYYATPAHRIIERELADRSTPGLSPDLLVPVSPLERRRIYEHLDSYSPPAESWQAIEEWEEREDRTLIARAPEDAQLEVALEVFRGSRPPGAD